MTVGELSDLLQIVCNRKSRCQSGTISELGSPSSEGFEEASIGDGPAAGMRKELRPLRALTGIADPGSISTRASLEMAAPFPIIPIIPSTPRSPALLQVHLVTGSWSVISSRPGSLKSVSRRGDWVADPRQALGIGDAAPGTEAGTGRSGPWDYRSGVGVLRGSHRG